MNKIEVVANPDSFAVRQSLIDEAHITGQEYIEKPHWYRNIETGQTYYDIFGCIGWPTEFSDKGEGAPGYLGVVGVVRPKVEGRKPEDAVFQLLTEREHQDVPTLLSMLLEVREEYGFGIYPGLMQTFIGNPNRFAVTLALLNERLVVEGGEKAAILVSPPDGSDDPKVFDSYVRSFKSVLVPDRLRFYFGPGNDIVKTRMREFKQGDPAIYAIGGLVHSLLSQCMWMDYSRETAFVVEDEIDAEFNHR